MEKDKIQEYTLRITQANRSELIVIMYDMIGTDLVSARQAAGQKDMTLFVKECRHAQKIVSELMACLDYQYTLAYDLLSLYSYLNRTLIAAYMKKDCTLLTEAEKIVGRLREAFVQVSSQDSSQPLMSNTQQVYAGLTYGRTALNEASMDSYGGKRGFTV